MGYKPSDDIPDKPSAPAMPASPAAAPASPATTPASPPGYRPSTDIPQGPTLPQKPTDDTPVPPGTVWDRATGGFKHGFVNDVWSPVAEAVHSIPGVGATEDWLNKQFPNLAKLDESVAPKPGENEEYEKTYGKDWVSKAGRFGGQMAATAPALLATEGVGAALGTRMLAPWMRTIFTDPVTGLKSVIGVAPGAARKLAAEGINLLTGAAGGAESALASGDNPLTGAIGGGVVRTGGALLSELGNSPLVQTIVHSQPVRRALDAIVGVGTGFASHNAGSDIFNAVQHAATAAGLTHLAVPVTDFVVNKLIAPTMKYGAGPLGDLAEHKIQQITKGASDAANAMIYGYKEDPRQTLIKLYNEGKLGNAAPTP